MMSSICQDCERLEIKSADISPDRPLFQQPTKYDHYVTIQKFKESKEDELAVIRKKEELLKLNSNFTNFDLNRLLTKEESKQLSTQDIQKVHQQLGLRSCGTHLNTMANIGQNGTGKRANNPNNTRNDLQTSEGGNDQQSLQKKKSLLALTRTPIQCPLSICNRTIGVTFVLSHYLLDHNEDFGVPCQEIYAGKRSVLIFEPTILNFRENYCLGILAYGGDANESSSRPSERGICINNAFLPKAYEHLATHLPILIMACRTSWTALLKCKGKEGNWHNPNNMNQELLVLWLASAQTVKPIHGTITVYDRLMTASRSTILKIRDLSDTQIPQEFMLKKTAFMRLSHGEINILSQQRTECIHLEIMINEY